MCTHTSALLEGGQSEPGDLHIPDPQSARGGDGLARAEPMPATTKSGDALLAIATALQRPIITCPVELAAPSRACEESSASRASQGMTRGQPDTMATHRLVGNVTRRRQGLLGHNGIRQGLPSALALRSVLPLLNVKSDRMRDQNVFLMS